MRSMGKESTGGGWTAPAPDLDRANEVTGRSDGDGPQSGSTDPTLVHLAVYEHRFGLDISVHVSRRAALAALGGIALDQCTRDPEIRAAAVRAIGGWNAATMDEDELEVLLDHWSELAPGEALWLSACVVENEEVVLRARARVVA